MGVDLKYTYELCTDVLLHVKIASRKTALNFQFVSDNCSGVAEY